MSTEKKIEQYLHLYIGCEVEYEGILNGKEMGEELKANKHDVFYIPKVEPVKGKKIGILKSIDVDMEGNYRRARIGRKGLQSHWGKANFKPLLSKLEDMPDEDIKGLINYDKLVEMYSGVEYSKEKNRIDIKYNVDVDDFGKQLFFHSIKFYQLDPAQFHYLLKKGYWLFGNSWFDEGLIIDKKTVKP